MKVVCISLKQANDFVANLHRHHKKTLSHKFSIAAVKNGVVVGVAISGRPVNRFDNFYNVIEVYRVCTDGTKNACSFLLGACARIARELGFLQIQTYTLQIEPGSSLRGSGWVCVAENCGSDKPWKHTDGKKRNQTVAPHFKKKWIKILSKTETFDFSFPVFEQPTTRQLDFFKIQNGEVTK